MRVKTQEGFWTDLRWWSSLRLNGGVITVAREEEILVLAQFATEDEAGLVYDEMNRRIRMGIPHFELAGRSAAGVEPSCDPPSDARATGRT